MNATAILVMAGNFEQFESYRRSRGLKPNDLIYLHRPYTAQKNKDSILIKTGNWNRRRDRRAIEQLIAQGHFTDVRVEEIIPMGNPRRGN